MPIPELNSQGLLRNGIFNCTLDEVQTVFGRFQGSDQGGRLFGRLQILVSEMRASGLFEEVLIDGSFVTAKAAPNDIDLIAVLRAGHDFGRDLPVSEYALLSRGLLKRRFGFDVIVAERDTHLYNTYVEFFRRVRENPNAQKGLLRLNL